MSAESALPERTARRRSTGNETATNLKEKVHRLEEVGGNAGGQGERRRGKDAARQALNLGRIAKKTVPSADRTREARHPPRNLDRLSQLN